MASSMLLLFHVLLAFYCHTALSWPSSLPSPCSNNGALRISAGSRNRGMLQICKNRRWHSVCDRFWDCNDAKVACRQLGFNQEGIEASGEASGEGSGNGTRNDTGSVISLYYAYRIYGRSRDMDNVEYHCTGSENSLSECTQRAQNSIYYRCYSTAGIYCYSFPAKPECSNDDVRLVGGSGPHEGRLEVCYNGKWSSACSIGTDQAGRVCERLGYMRRATVQSRGSFGSSVSLAYSSCLLNPSSQCTAAYSTSSCRQPQHCSAAIHCHLPCTTDGDIQLLNSTLLLQVCRNKTWHTVCRNAFGSCSNAKVACRQLGYTGLIAYRSLYNYNIYSQSNVLDRTQYGCRGEEKSLNECRMFGQYRYCSSRPTTLFCKTLREYDDGSGGCENGTVRLVGGPSEREGRVEICYDGSWSSLCGISSTVATTICQQLGYNGLGSVSRTRYYRSTESFISSVWCPLSATDLSNCTIHPRSFCTSSSWIPRCSTAITCHPRNCEDGQIRLTGGDIIQEGQVELCYRGTWSQFCSSRWNTNNAYVTCAQLGYSNIVNTTPRFYNIYKNRGGLLPVSSVIPNCNGHEKRLTDCPKRSYYYKYRRCYGTGRTAVRCYDDCIEGRIRLSGGPTASEGTLEICHNNLWGVVGDSYWENAGARVACRQLGLPSHDAVALNNSHYGRPRLVMHYVYMVCGGAEDKLTQCTKSMLSLTLGKTRFGNATAAGVSCYGPSTKLPCLASPTPKRSSLHCGPNGSIRLSGGQTSNEGRLEYCYNGNWSPFCTLRPQEATVACKQLGYTRSTLASVFTDGRFGVTSKHSLFQTITCSNTASETALSQCTLHRTDCLPVCKNIGIKCYDPGRCDEGSVRLADGVIEQEGRVEVCSNGVWTSVCDHSWGRTEAYVVCKQMGYPDREPVAYHNSYFGDGTGPIAYSNIACGGWEQKLTECSHKKYLSFSCPYRHTAGVLCGDDCRDGDVRIVGGASPTEGTVLVCYNNLWGMITENGWGDNDAAVVCRQLGYSGEGALAYAGSRFGKPSNMTIQASDVTCEGHERALSECSLTNFQLEAGKMMMSQVEVAGVSCQPCTPGVTNCAAVSGTPIPTLTVLGQTSAEQPLYAVIGVFCASILAALVVIILLIIFIWYKIAAYKKQIVAVTAEKSTKMKLKMEKDDENSRYVDHKTN